MDYEKKIKLLSQPLKCVILSENEANVIFKYIKVLDHSNTSKEESINNMWGEIKELRLENEKLKQQLSEKSTDDSILKDYYRCVFEDGSLSDVFDMYAFVEDDELSYDAIKFKSELLEILDKRIKQRGMSMEDINKLIAKNKQLEQNNIIQSKVISKLVEQCKGRCCPERVECISGSYSCCECWDRWLKNELK